MCHLREENGAGVWDFIASTEKKTKTLHNLKVENYVLFGGLAEYLSPEDSLLDSSEGLP